MFSTESFVKYSIRLLTSSIRLKKYIHAYGETNDPDKYFYFLFSKHKRHFRSIIYTNLLMVMDTTNTRSSASYLDRYAERL